MRICRSCDQPARHNRLLCNHCSYVKLHPGGKLVAGSRTDGKCSVCKIRNRRFHRSMCGHCTYLKRTGKPFSAAHHVHRCVECQERAPAKGRRVCGKCAYKLWKTSMTPGQWMEQLEYHRLHKKIGAEAANKMLGRTRKPGEHRALAA